MTRSTLNVGIVGAGPGGLTLAQGLRRAGIAVTVFDKDRERSDYVQGFRLRVRTRGLDALKANLPDALYRAVLGTAGLAPVETLSFDERFRPIAGGEGPVPGDDAHLEKSVSRITLRQVLLTGLEDTVVFGRRLTGYDENPDGTVTARFDDGGAERFDLLVGADGGNSAVRAQLLPDARRIDTGARRFAGKIALDVAEGAGLPRVLLDTNVHIRPTRGRSLMVTSHRIDKEAVARFGPIGADDPAHAVLGGSHFDNTASYVWWNIAFWKDEIAADDVLERSQGADLLALLAPFTADWHPDLRRLFELTDPSTVAVIPVRTSVPVPPWPTQAVTLLGDALHSMTYFRALGANSALYDAGLLAATLADVAAGRRPLLEAVAEYEAAARSHGFAAVTDSLAALHRALNGPQPLAA